MKIKARVHRIARGEPQEAIDSLRAYMQSAMWVGWTQVGHTALSWSSKGGSVGWKAAATLETEQP